MPWPFCVTKDSDCVISIWFTQCNHIWLTHAMPLPVPIWKQIYKATAWHGICELTLAVSWWPVGDLPRFRIFQLPRGHSQKSLIRLILPFGCFQFTQWYWWRQIIQEYTFWLTNLKVTASLSSVVLCLQHAFFSFSVYNSCLKFSVFKILILKYLKSSCQSSFRWSNRA